MFTDSNRADLCAAIYDPSSKWDAGPFEISGVYFAVIRLDGMLRFVFRGSKVLRDWFRDAQSVMVGELPNYPALGMVPQGFSTGMDAVSSKLFDIAGDEDSADFTGHSLGGSHAGIAAGCWASVGRIPSGALFAPARFGVGEMRSLLAPFHIPAYWNSGDGVPDEPPSPPWEDCARIVKLNEPASFHDRLLDPLFAHHHIQLYQQGVRKLFS